MAFRSITGELGDFQWTNDTDNWAAADSKWLQERGVVRVAVVSGNPANKPVVGTLPTTVSTPGVGNVIATPGEGRVFYDTTYHRLMVAIDGSQNYSYPLMAKKLQVYDTGDGSSTELRMTGAAAGTGVAITTNSITVYNIVASHGITIANGGSLIMLAGAGGGSPPNLVRSDNDLQLQSVAGNIVMLVATGKRALLPKITQYYDGVENLDNVWVFRGATAPTVTNVPVGTVWMPTA